MVVGLMAMGWLMTSFGEISSIFGSGEYDLIMVIKRPSGIGEGAPIYLSGVQVGRVTSLRFKDAAHLDAGVQIVGAIKKEYVIPQTATAIVQPAGMGLGRGHVDLVVPEGVDAPPLPEGEEITGVMGNPWGGMIPDNLLDSTERTVAQFGNFVEALTPVAHDLHKLFEQHPMAEVDNPASTARKITGNLSTVIERFDITLKAFNDTFADPDVKAGWIEMFANVRQMSADGAEALASIRVAAAQLRIDLQRIAEKLEGGIDDTRTHMSQIAGDIRPVLEHASTLAASLSRIAHATEQGEGTMGMVMKDPRLYESLLLASERLVNLIDRLDRIFQRFEANGAIGVDVKTGVGPIRKNFNIPQG